MRGTQAAQYPRLRYGFAGHRVGSPALSAQIWHQSNKVGAINMSIFR